MCGLAGYLTISDRSAYEMEFVVRDMVSNLIHRGPDGAGLWVDAEAGVALGHRRLSILDPSPAGHQPMVSSTGRYVIVFNGEIYNHIELRNMLVAQFDPYGPSWRGYSDTETLIACFEVWGVEKTLNSIVGMFAIVLWDRETRTLSLARDRVGEKPLYYGWQGSTFLFGSELKALRPNPAFKAEINRGVLGLFLRHNYVPAPYSIYEGIFKLPAGKYLQLKAGSTDYKLFSYWSLAAVSEVGMLNPFSGTEDEALDNLEQRLLSAVTGQMVADVPLGALLSGGIDSTAIVALMQANSLQRIRTFTMGFDEKAYDEASHARLVAQYLGTEHTELRLSGSDCLEFVPRIAEIFDEPFADPSQLPTFLLMKLARQHVAVALSGDGGDEMFGGYNRYLYAPSLWKKTKWMPDTFRNALGASLRSFPRSKINQLSQYLSPWIGFTQLGDKAHKLGFKLKHMTSLDQLYVSLVSEWQDSSPVVMGDRIPSNYLDNQSIWPKLEDPVARMMALDGLTYLPDDVLVKVDRSAMSVSLETRAPFLDRDLVEFAWSLPMEMKIRRGQGKWLLRRLIHRYVPHEIIERPKMGFGVPLDAWLRGPLRSWADELLSESRLRQEGYFDPTPIHAAWKAHCSGKASYGYRLWSVLMFQAWLEAQSV